MFQVWSRGAASRKYLERPQNVFALRFVVRFPMAVQNKACYSAVELQPDELEQCCCVRELDSVMHTSRCVLLVNRISSG
jgi:hypothetical protein